MRFRTVRPLATIALTGFLALPAFASAAVPLDRNPFHAMDIGAMVSQSSDVREISGGRLELRRTGDTVALASLASDSMSAPTTDGRYLLVVPFSNTAGAQHSALVFAADGKEAYQVGGFAARGDHFFVSLSGAIVVAFFARPSGGRTLAAGGPAPTSTAQLGVVGRHLTEITTTAPAATLANASGE